MKELKQDTIKGDVQQNEMHNNSNDNSKVNENTKTNLKTKKKKVLFELV